MMAFNNMYNPPHPGEIIKEIYLDPLDISITKAAADLGISRVALSEIVNGRRGVSPEMAIRLSKAFDTEVSMWLSLQSNYDLWHLEIRKPDIRSQVKEIILKDSQAGQYPLPSETISLAQEDQSKD